MSDHLSILMAPSIKSTRIVACDSTADSNITTVVNSILATNRPTIISFGELHHDGNSKQRSTIETFTAQALPALAQHGFADLVIEFLRSDPEIIADLIRFYNYQTELTIQDTPHLYRLINYPMHKGALNLLIRCRQLGIKPHPGGPTLTELQQPDIQAELCCNRLWTKTIQLYNNRLTNAILRIAHKGRRVASFSGLRHNDVDRSLRQGSFGALFAKHFGRKYVEIDLVNRRRLLGLRSSNNPNIIDYATKLYYYENNASSTRNVCLRSQRGQYTIILK